MKIRQGLYKGIEISAPFGVGVRPTSDHLKKEIFKLVDPTKYQRMWDLFAGSGNLGLEFLSARASEVVFVEQLRKAGDLIELNLGQCRFKNPQAFQSQKAILVRASAETFLKSPHAFEVSNSADFIFLDPPYGQNIMSKIPLLLKACPLVTGETLILAEHVTDDPLDAAQLDIVEKREFGPKALTLFKLKY